MVLGRPPEPRTPHFATAGGGHAGRSSRRLHLAKKTGFRCEAVQHDSCHPVLDLGAHL
jgi:hypothetical protein